MTYVLSFGKHEVALAAGTFRIGRDPECEIRLHDESVSRQHATLTVTDRGVVLRDHSRNGARVNGDRVRGPTPLDDGDAVTVGTVTLVLSRTGAHGEEAYAATRPLPKILDAALADIDRLSPRERVVFEGLVRGRTQRAIAEDLGLSVKTVETYRARLAEKLGARTRAELIEVALRAGMLRPDSGP